MEYRQFVVWVMASWLCIVSTGLSYPKDLNHPEMANGLIFNNNTEDMAFNETESVTTDGITGSTADTTTSHSTLEKITKIVKVTAVESKHRGGLVPLAVGGLALLSGLLFLAFVVGVFMYCNRNPGFVYERAPAPETILHV